MGSIPGGILLVVVCPMIPDWTVLSHGDASLSVCSQALFHDDNRLKALIKIQERDCIELI